jgi:hydroxymethylbilane synthase
MNLKGHVKIGSRGSKLALVQSRSVVANLSRIYPHLKFELTEVSTTGDRSWEIPLDKLGSEGVFVKDLEEALLKGRIDLAVHSLKDMPTFIPEGLRLAAVTERGDPRDVLVSRSGKLSELPKGSKIGTGSPRRAVQLLAQRPDLQIYGLRGNIETRLRKVSPLTELDGIITAAAALIRLGMEDRVTEHLPPETFVPAVGQGALGIEIRSSDTVIAEIVAPLNDELAWQEVTAERVFLKSLGGGCRAPIAAFGRANGGILHLRGMVSDSRGTRLLHAEVEGNASASEQIGNELARKMVDMGASRGAINRTPTDGIEIQ